MTPEQAIQLLHELVVAEVEVCKRMTKKAERREYRAVSDIFVALVGVKPTAEQLEEIASF